MLFRPFAAALILLSAPIQIQLQTSPPLEKGKEVQGEVAAGKPDYQFVSLYRGQYLRVEVVPQDADVVVRIQAASQQVGTEVESPYGPQEPVPASFVAKDRGVYRLTVSATAKNLAPHAYEMKIEELRPGTHQDELRVRAQEALVQALRLQRKGSKEELHAASAKFEQALSFWRAAGDRLGESWALNGLGDVRCLLSDDAKALAYLKEALGVRQSLMDRRGEGQSLDDLGDVYDDLGEEEKALDSYTQALALRQAIGDRRGEQESLSNIGNAHNNRGDQRTALDFYNRALTICRAISDREDEATILHNIGKVQDDLGDEEEALDSYKAALALRREVGDRQGEAVTLNNMGLVFEALGEEQTALDYFTQALRLRRAVGDRRGEARTLSHIGNTYRSLGETQQALDYLNRALEMLRSVGDQLGEVDTLNVIGLAYYSMGKKNKALGYFNSALVLSRAKGYRYKEGAILNNIGRTNHDLGRKQAALQYYGRALSIRQSVEDKWGEAATFNDLAKVYDEVGDRAKAFDSYNEALALARTVGDRRTEASILYGIAQVERDRRNLLEAKAQIEESLAVIESLRTNVLSPELKASYSGTLQTPYETYVDLLMQLDTLHPGAGYAVKALEVNERRHARGLLELLGEARTDIRQGISPELRERERSLRQALDAKSDHLVHALGGHPSDAEITITRREIDELLTQYQEVEGKIRESSPRYAALTQAQTLDLRQIQDLLDPDTLLLEYALGEERSYLWVVGEASVASFQLPNRATIDKEVRRFRADLTARSRRSDHQAEVPTQARVARTGSEYPQATGALSRMVLSPAAALVGRRRLVIVADGALQYVPFAALLVPDQGQKPVPLMAKHEIVNLPSASVLGALRQGMPNRKPAEKLIAILADPVFSPDDSRVGGPLKEKQDGDPVHAQKRSDSFSDPELVRAMRSVRRAAGRAALPRLWFSRREADTIFGLIPAGKGREVLDFDANLRAATSAELGRYDIVHFATHGVLNTEYPQFSGLVLSLVDRNGRPQRGFLSLEGVYNLNLVATNLVVLSACDTALGEEIKGEGLIGLTRGFMYAGARSVVSSLWEVNDIATAEMMGEFYRGMLLGHLDAAAALQAAQLKISRQARWSSPYYWAGLTLSGDWSLSESNPTISSSLRN